MGAVVNEVEDLVLFILHYFDELNEQQWSNLMRETLQIYPFEKPKDVQEAIDIVWKYSSIPIGIRPLFPDV
jgi:hypothetical protein